MTEAVADGMANDTTFFTVIGTVRATLESIIPVSLKKAMGASNFRMEAYRELITKLVSLEDVVKANPITPDVPETPAARAGKLGSLDSAAAKLTAASMPCRSLVPRPWRSQRPSTRCLRWARPRTASR